MTEMTVKRQAERRITAENTEELMQKFIEALDVDSENSRNTYKRQLRQFFQYLSEKGLLSRMTEMTVDDIVQYKHFLNKRVSTVTVNGYLTAVRRFYAWLEARRIFPDIAKSVKNFKKEQGHSRDNLSGEEIKEVLEHINKKIDREKEDIDRQKEKAMRDFALVNLMARTGLRDIEVSRALVGDIRKKGGKTVLYVQGKGRKEKKDFVVLTEKALKPIQDYLAIREKAGQEQPLFASVANRNRNKAMTTRSISRVIKEVLKETGLATDRVSAHSFRHSAITIAIEKGATLIEAQAMARHSNPQTTMNYFHDVERIKNAAENRIDF